MQVETLIHHVRTYELLLLPSETRSAISTDADSIFSLALRTLWKSLVEPVIHFLKLESPSPPSSTVVPHMFAFLPIHAAGIYNTEGGENASDYIVHPILLL